jgi:hypothetical protein
MFNKHKSIVGLVKFSNGAYTNILVPHGILPGFLLKTTSLPTRIISTYNVGDCVLLV